MNPRRWPATFGWGLFCACSWTWCIALYLPVLLLRQFGWCGFLAFSIPNVLGCAAFGYVLRSRARSEALVAQHHRAMRWFSIAAIAYQAYFIAFLTTVFTSPHQQTPWLAPALGGAVIGVGFLLSALPTRAWPVLGIAVYLVSLATFAVLGVSELTTIPWDGERSGGELIWLAPVLAFGFLLCPYLDLTFHRALQESPSRHAFAIFGAAFTVMILLTCAYRDRLTVLAVVPLAHIVAQSIFTVAAHLRELRPFGSPQLGWQRALVVILPLASVLLVLAANPRESPEAGERIYLRFLVFFGLIFPAYVLLFVGPGRTLRLSRRNVTAYGAAVLVALPLYELGFIHGRSWLLVVPLAGLLAWRWVGGKRRNIETPKR